jgi:DNA repair exonuclease SbcCD ATPase subunit|tara:strand:+ start:2150 stop:4522 length:2373 start_codon:yes stop_codon:yes gene_type:complete
VDLFNPPKLFNYNIMIKNLDFSVFENPTVQVVWEDLPENFTQDKIKSVKYYFQKKYNTTNVNVLTKSKIVETDTTQSIDVSVNISDKNYQLDLIKNFLVSKDYNHMTDDVLSINNMVENKMSGDEENQSQFKKWYIRNIEFSNFLSYGENQKLDFDKLSGIVVVESDPPNFGGKTVLTVDLLMFLFFNETTKTTKAEEIFNRFSNKDKVHVKGEITIDGEDYVIVRNIERKMSKKNEWNVKTELDFFKKLSDGTLLNFTGEQRRETESFIKNSIGTKEDFLTTILTTGSNLEDLLEAKPTSRGQVLSRFMGLEFLKRKEEVAKEIYGDFSKQKISNIYSSEQLKNEIETHQESILELNVKIKNNEQSLFNVNDAITKGKSYRDDMLKKKHTNINHELSLLKPDKTRVEIQEIEIDKNGFLLKISEIKVVEPSEFYYENKHDEVKEQYNEVYKETIKLDTEIESITKLKSEVEGGIKCSHCGIELMNASITNAKITELDGLIVQKNTKTTLMHVLSSKEQSFVQLKKEFDEYEKNKLIKEKYELSIESCDLKIESLNDKIKRWEEIQDKIQENQKIDSLLIKADIRLDDLEIQRRTISNSITTSESSIKSLEEKIDLNKNKIETIKEEEKKDKIYKIYLEIYGKNGISKMIMKTMMPLINSELQRLMEDSCYFKLEVRINDKNEVEFIMTDNETGIEKLMTSGSGFEKTISSLALRSVLTKISSLPKPNLVVLDEVFGKIANDNLEMVYEFFTKIKDYFEKIFVISHNSIVGTWGDHVVKIKKENNFSKVL